MQRVIITYDELDRTGYRESVLLPLSKSIFAREAVVSALSGNIKKLIDILAIERNRGREVSQDIDTLFRALIPEHKQLVDVGASGTALRLLLSYFALTTDTEIILSGSERIKQRPLTPLIEALRNIGAHIDCLEMDGYAPIKIGKSNLRGGHVSLDPGISSQFVTSLLLIAPYLPGGLTIEFLAPPVSVPYIHMTVEMMIYYGISVDIKKRCGHIQSIRVRQGTYREGDRAVERDWSAAAFFYMYEALADYPATMVFDHLYLDSIQGDVVTKEYFLSLGILTTETEEKGIALDKLDYKGPDFIEVDFEDCPDMMPAWVVTATLLGLRFEAKGIDNLKYKESDRVLSVMSGLEKIGYKLTLQNKNRQLILRNDLMRLPVSGPAYIDTCNDHRIAMAFTMAAIKYRDGIVLSNLCDADKSFPNFAKEAQKCGLIYNVIDK